MALTTSAPPDSRAGDLYGSELVKAIGRLGHRATRRTGDHIARSADPLTPHHCTIAAHDPLQIGAPAAAHGDAAADSRLDQDELLRRLFG